MIESCGLTCKVCKSSCDRVAGHSEDCSYPVHRERDLITHCAHCGWLEKLVSPVIASDGAKCCDSHCLAYYEHGLSHDGDCYCNCGRDNHEIVATHKSTASVPRNSWPQTWMVIALAIADRSYDPRLKVGAIVVTEDNTQMLAVGYNGNYKGGPHVHESDEPGQSGFIHAEVNALVKCDFSNHKVKHMYLTHSPCRACAKLIINAGICRVVFNTPYRDKSGLELLRSAGVEVHSLKEAILMIEDEHTTGS